MSQPLLFAQQVMHPFNDEQAPKQSYPTRDLRISRYPSSSTSTNEDHLNSWLDQQQQSRRPQSQSQFQQPISRTMSQMNHNNYIHPGSRTQDDGSGYTFTTHAPNPNPQTHDPFLQMWHTGSSAMFSGPQMHEGSSSLPTQSRMMPPAHMTSSSAFSSSWNQLAPYNVQGNDPTLSAAPFVMDNYSQESVGSSSLNPYHISRPPSSQVSPTGSDPSLSPHYSEPSRLPTPTTPGTSHQHFRHSPSTSAEMKGLSVLETHGQGSSSTSDKKQYTHREQLILFREALSLPMDGAGPFVPQHMYKPHTTSDRKRYVEEVLLEAPLYFQSENATQCGILLKDALQSRTKKLLNRDQVVFEGRGPSVSIRLEWPGYRQWSRQIPTKDFRSPPGPITLAKLAKNVAKCVQRFMQDRKTLPMEDEADHRWRIGDGVDDIKLEDLVLVSIHHVSLGSWQPQLRLARPRPQRYIQGHSPRSQAMLPPTPMSATHSLPTGTGSSGLMASMSPPLSTLNEVSFP